MKILENKKYATPPSNDNLSSYPTMMDIIEEIAGEEEKKNDFYDPLHRTILARMTRKGFYLLAKENEDSEFVELLPGGKIGTLLYRGQCEYYEDCKPSLYRNFNEYELLLSNLQIAELKVLLDSHPILNLLTKNKFSHPQLAEPIRFKIHYRGLAQHYGIHTELVDFTVDKWTAAFFATTRYVNGSYLPIVGKEALNKYGVFYIYDNYIKKKLEATPIGMHYFNRPGVQCAYALAMDKGQNLNNLVGIRKLFFRHDTEASSLVYAMHQAGKTLFPEDSLADKVKIIIDKKTFSLAALVECNASYYHLPDDVFKELLDKYDIQVQATPVVSFQGDTLDKEWAEWQNGGKERYMNSLTVLPIIRF